MSDWLEERRLGQALRATQHPRAVPAVLGRAETLDPTYVTEAMPPTGKSRMSRSLEALLLPLSLAGLIGAWHFAVLIFQVPSYIVPSPAETAVALGRIFTSGLLWENFGITLLEAFTGFGIGFCAALVMAIAITEIRLFEKTVYPYVAALQSMPKVALAPLIVLWFGFGIESKIVMSALLCFFPMLVNFVGGFRAADEMRIRLMRVLDASTWQIIRHVRLPSALPFVLAGVELGAIYAMLGAIVAEFVGARHGIGYWLMQMNATMDSAGSVAILALLAAYGICIQALLRFARRKLLFWNGARTVAEEH